MKILKLIYGIAFLGWGIFTFRTVFLILKLCWPVLKQDWFWLATKSGFYKGILCSIAWAALDGVLNIWLNDFSIVPLLLVQFALAYLVVRRTKLSPLQQMVWFSIPFFTLPVWLAARQGQRQGEIRD